MPEVSLARARSDCFANHEKYEQPDHEEDEEQDLRDPHGCARNSGETEQTRNQRNDEKYK